MEAGKAEKLFSDLGRKIDELFRSSGKSDHWKKEFDLRVDELRRNRDTLEHEFQRLRNDEGLKDVATRIENALQDIIKAVENAFSKKKK